MKRSRDPREDMSPAGGLESVRAALKLALIALDEVLGPSGIRVRFRRRVTPYNAGEEVVLPTTAAVAAIGRGDAEYVASFPSGKGGAQ